MTLGIAGPADWYQCGETYLARYGDPVASYCSGRFGECVSLTRIDRAVLMLGFELSSAAKERLLRLLLAEEWRRQPRAVWREYAPLMDAPKLGHERWVDAWE